ncbi:MAG: tetratricopeptide repeat protein, partial [Planctomycetota bacterium]
AHTSQGLAVAQERMATIKAATQWDMARQQFLTGDLEKALKSVEEALSINPSVAKSHSLKGRILLEMGQLEQALRSFKKALAINPSFEEAQYFLGVVYERFNEYDLALQAYRKAAELAPDDPQYAIAAAEMLIEQGKLDEAEAFLMQGADAFKHNAGVRQTLGHIALLRHQPSRAVRYFTQARLLAPDDPAALEDLAFAQMEAGQYADAERSLEQLLQDKDHQNRNDLKRLRARALVELHRPVEARSILLELSRDPQEATDPQLWIDLASVAMLIDDWRLVRQAAARAVGVAPNRYEPYMHLAAWARHRGDSETALRNIEKAIALAPVDPAPYMLQGLILQEAGRRDEAARAYAKAATMRSAGVRRDALATVEDDDP